jgi:hypothetical protein
MSWDSGVSVRTGYWLNDRGLEVRVLVGAKFYTSYVVQTGFGVFPNSYSWAFSEDKMAGT